MRRECEKYCPQIPETCPALTFFSRLKTDVFRTLFELIQSMMIVDNGYGDKEHLLFDSGIVN